MDRSLYFYYLPKEKIAQHPKRPRDHSKMMYLDRVNGSLCHLHFYNLIDKLEAGDLLVVNDSKVIPARLYGKNTNDKMVEILLLRNIKEDYWECIVHPGKVLKPGEFVSFGDKLSGEIINVTDNGNREILFHYNKNESLSDIIDQNGQIPLPHYIKSKLRDPSDYQTIYAKHPGSAAAPTAGFHFTNSLLEKLESKGISIASITLHVGLGTFRPVKSERIEDHIMHNEYYSLTDETAAVINNTINSKGRIIAVGTTSCRTLEAVYKKYGEIRPCSDKTDIFIYPGFEFKVTNGLVTNFHLPESTLIMLVSAFAGYNNTMQAYNIAVKSGYRFYSFGDAMLIL